MVLDRAVTRVFGSGATMTLTHEIVRVDSKDAIDRWGEIEVPAGAEILTLRTHKPDGTTREPEEIAGKESVSAADLAIGDYVEWELLETHGPSEAFAPGFLAERFFFQSFDAPIARSELVLVTPAGLPLAVDARAGAPKAGKTSGAPTARSVTTFVAHQRPSALRRALGRPGDRVRPLGARVERRGLERLGPLPDRGAARRGSRLARGGRAGAGRSRRAAGGDRARIAAAIVDWVTENIEATDELAEPAGVHAGARARQPGDADAGAGRGAGPAGRGGAGPFAPGRRRGRGRRRRRSSTTSATRWSAFDLASEEDGLQRSAAAPRGVRLRPAGARRRPHAQPARRLVRRRPQRRAARIDGRLT